MASSSLRKVGALDPQVRAAIEALLGRALSSDESVSVRAYRPKPAPTAEERAAAYRVLLARSGQTAGKVKDIPEAEVDAAIDEATEFVRRNPE